MTKKALRSVYRERRKGLNPADQHAMLAAMQEYFRQIPLQKEALVFSFKPMAAKNEVETMVFEYLLETEFGATGFCYPSIPSSGGGMEAFLDDEDTTWEEVAFGLTQPASGNKVAPQAIDIVLVPLLAFDGKGHRLGYGKGFYDEYLAQCRPDVQTVGLSWFEAEQTPA